MSARIVFTTSIFALTLIGAVAPATGPRSSPSPAIAAAQSDATTTIEDQTDVGVTVYNSDLALVRDVRNVRVGTGTSDLHFMDIAATVNPASVHFRSLSEPPRLNVLEQNYEYDLLEPDKLLRKYVGRDVVLVRRGTGPGAPDQEVTARLLSYNGAPVWQINGEIVTGLQADHIRFPELPGNLYYEFKNEARAGLGMPLPAGTVRVYQSDSGGGTQFVGEDHVDHTPKDEAINLRIGSAFDVACERKRIDYQRVGNNVSELEYELVIRNHKNAPISVEVNEPIGGSWRMLRASHNWTKTAASAAQFMLPVPVDGTVRLTYRVRVTN